MEPRLIFYTTVGCHLCEYAENMLQALVARQGISVEAIDISSDEALVERYGLLIPVVRNPRTQTELGWPFSEAELLSLV